MICSFYYLARALMHDVACEFACAEGCAEKNSANVLNQPCYPKIERLVYNCTHQTIFSAYLIPIKVSFLNIFADHLFVVVDFFFCRPQLLSSCISFIV